MIKNNLENIFSPNIYKRINVSIEQNHKPLIIAGSGPSLQRINYKRLPKDFLTFRINNFFLEDKYYLGKKVDMCYVSMPRPEALYTLANVITDHEYDFTSDYIFTRERVTKRFPPQEYSPRVEIEKILSLDAKMYSYMTQIFYFQEKHVTSGILALLSSIAMGFKDIYLIGLDFYSDENQRYGFKIGENYRKAVEEQDLLPGYSENFHSREIDLKGLDIALSYKDVKIRSLCDDAFVNQFIDLAPKKDKPYYTPIEKDSNAILDYLDIPSKKTNLDFSTDVLKKSLLEMKSTLLVKIIWGVILKPLIVIPLKTLNRLIKYLTK